MAAYPGTLYLCLVGIAIAAALVCVVLAGEVRLDACLWLAIAFVASVLYFVMRTASDAIVERPLTVVSSQDRTSPP
jgi:hypothetical protein